MPFRSRGKRGRKVLRKRTALETLQAGALTRSGLSPHDNGIRTKKRLSADYQIEPPIKPARQMTPAETQSRTPPDSDPHDKAVQGLAHFAEHGDYTKLTGLMETLARPKSKKAFADWCLRFARLRWNPETGQFIWKRGPRDFDLELAKATSILNTPSKRRDIDGIRQGKGRTDPVKAIPPRSPFREDRTFTRCVVCGAPAMPGEDTCYGHMSG